MLCVPYCSHWAVNADGSLVEYGVYTNEKMLQSLYRNSMPIFGISYSELLREIIALHTLKGHNTQHSGHTGLNLSN